MSSDLKRKLAAIMFTDIAAYTDLSSKDENKALALLDKQEEILTPIIEEFSGTLHNRIGDGLLFTFPTVTDAIKCGIKIQKETKKIEDLNLRIGIHEGEVTLKDGDVLGDDVNVASRIDPFAAEGGIVISGKVQQNISSLPEFETKFISEPSLKGVRQDVKVFCIISHGLPETDITKVTAKLEKDVKKLGSNQKSIIVTLVALSVLIIGSIIWISKDNIGIDNQENESVDIFISGVQSEQDDLNAGFNFLHWYAYDSANPKDSPKLDFSLINEDELDKLYQDVIINSTTKFYDIYDLVTLEDMQDRLASRGELMNFDDIPSVLSSIDKDGLFGDDKRNAYDSIGDFLTKEFEKKPIYMFRIYAYEFTPPVAGNNIVGFVDFLDVNDHFGSDGFSTNIKDFGKDVSEVISQQISSIFYQKYPSSILSVNGDEVLIKINKLAKPKKMSTFNSLNRDYSNCENDPHKFYKQRLEEMERMISYCDTTKNDNYIKYCNMFLSDELNIYIYSQKEYDDLLNNTHSGFGNGRFSISIETNILIKDVFDSTAIGIIDNSESLPWIQVRQGDKLVLK